MLITLNSNNSRNNNDTIARDECTCDYVYSGRDVYCIDPIRDYT